MRQLNICLLYYYTFLLFLLLLLIILLFFHESDWAPCQSDGPLAPRPTHRSTPAYWVKVPSPLGSMGTITA